jgi:T-complex protein 1 subunit gamma
MILSAGGSILLTNDGNSILREIGFFALFYLFIFIINFFVLFYFIYLFFFFLLSPDVTSPAARTIIQLSRAQDEEVGDGTTSVIVLGFAFRLFISFI